MRDMRDSGVEWIGEIPAEWAISKVGMFYHVTLGKMLQPESKDANDTYESYLCAANLGNNTLKFDNLKQMWFSSKDREQYEVSQGDLIVVEGGDVASCDIIRQPVQNLYIQNAVHRVRAKGNYSLDFLRYWLMTAKNREYISLLCNKATIAHFTKDKFLSLVYCVASVDEQRKISLHLDEKCSQVDTLIANVQTQIKKLKAYKQSLITEVVTKGVDTSVLMKDSGVEWIGNIPVHWRVVPINALFKIKKDIIGREPDCVLSITQQGLRVKDISVNEGQMAANYQKYQIVNIGDFAMNHMDLLTGGVGISEYEGVTSPDYRVFTLRDTKMNPRYFLYLFQMYYRNRIFYAFGQGAANVGRWRLPAQNFKTTPIPLAPVDEQNAIVEYLDTKLEKIDRLVAIKQKKIDKLNDYKKSLIYEYVTGKREVV